MPNGPTHQLLGALSGAAAAHHYVASSLSPLERKAGTSMLVVGGLIAGGLGGRIPDLLDPPLHPNHRAFFHSVVAGCAVAGAAALTVKKLGVLLAPPGASTVAVEPTGTASARRSHPAASVSLDQALVFALVLALLVGVLSHLAADAGTPKGLPLIG